jgi:ATP-dependent RNA/DNA helicase IGHMBP2
MDHFDRLLALLDLESEAEKQRVIQRLARLSPREAEGSGQSLIGLRICDASAGLGGRTIVLLGKRDPRELLPWSRLNVGSPVVLSPQDNKDDDAWRGIVCARSRDTISVALADWPEIEEATDVRLDASFDETSRQRQRTALLAAKEAPDAQKLTIPLHRLGRLREILLGRRPFGVGDPVDEPPLNHALNASQRDAVAFALAANDVAVIHGPPGTGKTTTVVELIRRAAARGQKVLACAPSNLAVDNLLERLVRYDEQAIRLGHPARVLPELREHTLDLMVDAHPDMKVAKRLVKEAHQLRDKADRFTRAKPAPGAKREMRQESRALIADARRLEEQVATSILDHATVVCATLTGIDPAILGDRRFDLAVIDEAGQTTEPACWIPLLRSDRLVLAGDPFQLPPTVVSTEAAQAGFAVSLLERLMAAHGETVARRLTIQYRMHEQIAAFSSAEFYERTLMPDASVATHLLADLPGVEPDSFTSSPLEFVDTAGAGYDEEVEPDGESRLNSQEANIVQRRITQLLERGIAARDIAVISPYAAQVRHLRELLDVEDLEIDTVDGFQGREKEAIIISLVRSNGRGEIGFLGDIRRMNVALTRARRKLIVIGDSATIGGQAFYSRLLSHFEAHRAYRTVWQEM